MLHFTFPQFWTLYGAWHSISELQFRLGKYTFKCTTVALERCQQKKVNHPKIRFEMCSNTHSLNQFDDFSNTKYPTNACHFQAQGAELNWNATNAKPYEMLTYSFTLFPLHFIQIEYAISARTHRATTSFYPPNRDNKTLKTLHANEA